MNIGISWHMTDDGKANANSVIEGNLRLYEGDKDYMGSSLNIYMESPQRAALAAAAINGDLAELRRLLDVADAGAMRAADAAEAAKPDANRHSEYLREKAEQV